VVDQLMDYDGNDDANELVTIYNDDDDDYYYHDLPINIWPSRYWLSLT